MHDKSADFDFNPRSPHGERHLANDGTIATATISIHAPRTGSDRTAYLLQLGCINFNPRSPHGERRNPGVFFQAKFDISIHAPRTGSDAPSPDPNNYQQFQSTLPARGATKHADSSWACAGDFNPRSPHGERPVLSLMLPATEAISIHAPRTGSDIVDIFHVTGQSKFQSTLPARGATALIILRM